MTSVTVPKLRTRQARTGAFRVDVLILVLVILGVIGTGIGVFVSYESYRKDVQYAAKTVDLVDRQQAEWSTLQESALRSSEVLGFRGEGRALSNPAQISEMLRGYEARGSAPGIFTINSNTMNEIAGAPGDGSSNAGVQRSRENNGGFANAGMKATEYREKDDGFRTHLFGLYRTQGLIINDYIDEVHNVNLARKLEYGRYLIANQNRASIVDDMLQRLEDRRQVAEEQLAQKAAELDVAISEAGDEQEAANQTHRDSQQALRDADARVQEEREKVRGPLRDAARAREAVGELLARRIRAETDDLDFDGKVMMVDENSGYVFINLGYDDGVQLEQTFTVLRPSAQSGHRIVAAIRIKEVISESVSRCRIDSFDTAGDWPRSEDLIRNENFSTEPYRYYALMGEFGGNASRYSRLQLRDMLARYNKIVVDSPTDPNFSKIEVVVVGRNWQADPIFNALALNMSGTGRLKEFYTVFEEDDLLYSFGLASMDDLR